jgi:hemin uptake protein HemP
MTDARDTPTTDATQAAPLPPLPAPHGPPQRFSSATLLQGAPEIEIEHNGAVYRLRQTSQGKLILTK